MPHERSSEGSSFQKIAAQVWASGDGNRKSVGGSRVPAPHVHEAKPARRTVRRTIGLKALILLASYLPEWEKTVKNSPQRGQKWVFPREIRRKNARKWESLHVSDVRQTLSTVEFPPHARTIPKGF